MLEIIMKIILGVGILLLAGMLFSIVIALLMSKDPPGPGMDDA